MAVAIRLLTNQIIGIQTNKTFNGSVTLLSSVVHLTAAEQNIDCIGIEVFLKNLCMPQDHVVEYISTVTPQETAQTSQLLLNRVKSRIKAASGVLKCKLR
jgi:hypothetical protein